MNYQVAYTQDAARARGAMPVPLRRRFDTDMTKLADDPYALGSTPIRGERDRRDATVAGCFIVYYVARQAERITAVRLQSPF